MNTRLSSSLVRALGISNKMKEITKTDVMMVERMCPYVHKADRDLSDYYSAEL